MIPTLDQVVKGYVNNLLDALSATGPILSARVVVNDGDRYAAGWQDALKSVAIALGVSDELRVVPPPQPKALTGVPAARTIERPAQTVSAHDHNGDESEPPPLTVAEWRVAEQLAQGLILKQIAERLSVGYTTVKSQTQSIYFKLGINNRDEFLKWWLEHQPAARG